MTIFELDRLLVACGALAHCVDPLHDDRHLPRGLGAGEALGRERNLCLVASRFRVEVEWRNQRNGERGSGHALEGSDQSGGFWFFDADNVELIVKALDGRQITGAWWIFYGALSDVEYWIVVTDTETGVTRIYRNEPFDICGRGDTAAFPEAGGEAVSTGSNEALPTSSWLPAPLHPALDLEPRLQSRDACVPGDLTLCLLDGRFEVEVGWRNHRNGDTGVGTAIPFSDRSGFFWFFDSGNTELVVKALDGQSVNGSFWFFYGARTRGGGVPWTAGASRSAQLLLRSLWALCGEPTIADDLEGAADLEAECLV